MPIRSYEALYILRPDLNEEQIGSLVKKFERTVEESGGKLLKTDPWGLRVLAYEIQHFDKGYYVLMEFQATPEQIRRLDERFKLDENVLRYQIAQQC
ncbi:MAG: 30S ribosomal protein S6 [Candidatus Bipolaricaulota bacterium]|nr:30S ribosomal protein S6 [Candidatus Bipolaricaulota bacterium]MCS7274851.1 30S ribosomal protein S6 [Candidatus Bipolaricaulota bacterium]MDW8111272.1 30S ribosomal protein S6 [Candidatus Bipolaricaulota bacterium]MDW8328592.1 30S ribosomal protein S6 [Candidatus Bipolaricaulota bacterium]